jgi:hypothetical protein
MQNMMEQIIKKTPKIRSRIKTPYKRPSQPIIERSSWLNGEGHCVHTGYQ